MQLHAEDWLTWQIFRKNFYSGKKNKKRSICRHLRQRNAAHFDQCMKASNRWCLKSADKSDEEIIKSFSVKQK
jgi:predicted HD phosphohydrolase